MLALNLLLFLSWIAQAEERLRVIDHGTDGDARYYTVICPSGERSSITNYYEEGKICTMLVNGKIEICRVAWEVDSAAREACK
jgi:hypothetical protein